MPTAVEYAVQHWHVQNGCGSGPPAQNVLHTQNGAGSGPPHTQNGAGTGPPAANQATAVPPPMVPAGELLVTSPLAVLLLIAAVLATIRRRAHRSA